MENKNPMIRLVMMGKIKKMIKSYIGATPLTQLDKNLIRGLYKRKLKDFDED